MFPRHLIAVLPLALLAPVASSQTTARASVGPAGQQLSDGSWWGSISSTGRYVAFQSLSPNVVAGDTNNWADIFVHDFQTGANTRVSVSTSGGQANQDCGWPVISRDGSCVVFISRATFDPFDQNVLEDVFVHDSLTGQTTRVSVDSNGATANSISSEAVLSSNGQVIAFTSQASNLVAGDTNSQRDVFVHEMSTGATTRVSVDSAGAQGNGQAWHAALSGDGRYVAFSSNSSNLVAGDTNAFIDIFVHDRTSGQTTRVSLGLGGAQPNGHSDQAGFSSDGRRLAFWSDASNLVSQDTNGMTDLFVRDLALGQNLQVNMNFAGQQANGGSSFQYSYDPPVLSEDGRFIAYHSDATDLVVGDTNGKVDVFVRDVLSGTTARASLSDSGQQATEHCVLPWISGDGRFVSFESLASNLVGGDSNNRYDIFRRDLLGSAAHVVFCAGDGVAASCPCANSGLAWRGCENSAGTGGAQLLGAGNTAPDTLVLNSKGELPTALSIFLQGNAELAPPVVFGDGLRCAGGTLKRLYTKNAIGGAVLAPGPGDNSVSVQSALLGDPIPPGSTRCYQVYFRDPSASFCPAPGGNTWNVSNALRVYW